MERVIDKNNFGPWAIITGASSGIGKEFAHQLASNGLNLVLVARRVRLLEELVEQLTPQFNIQCKIIAADLSERSAIQKIIEATKGLEIGLLVSNAGTGKVGKFFSISESDHEYILQLNAISHMRLTHHFGSLMARRKKGGIILTGAMGAVDGVPYMANEAGTKGYIQSLGKSLHTELKELGLHITTLITTPTETPVFYKLGFTLKNTPVKPLTVQQCVTETLIALQKNKITVLPGLKFRVINALTPAALSRKMTGKIMKQNNNL